MTAGFDPARNDRPFRRIGLAAEHESPENPHGSEVRVALTPGGVESLVRHGCTVAVERGAGAAMGYSDASYRAAGAAVQARADLYRGKDLVIKLKGPAHHDLARMDPGSSLLCMAHAQSIPKRVAVADAHAVNLIAMELIRESPELLTDSYIRSRLAMEKIFAGLDGHSSPQVPDACSVAFVGFSADAFGAVQYAARCRPRSLQVLQRRAAGAGAAARGAPGRDPALLTVGVDELAEIAAGIPPPHIDAHRAAQALKAFGKRRIQCLHETGRAGALFGIDLALARNRHLHGPACLRTTILGYGNVAFGALDECLRHGVPTVDILTRRATERPRVQRYLRNSDLIINGVEQPPQVRGRSYIITDNDLRTVLRPGTVVVDLVGGCATNRTAVEPIVECTYPADPYTVRNGVCLASVWGWPLMGFQKESVECYSRQIVQVLLHDEQLINGLGAAPPGILQALVAGPALRRRPSSQQMALSATLGG
ncbi:hypothetical protein LE181_01190 [Streptomyces sp. SCA3-4]|uniref:hypothetical protein n=1 Tax=Streptomyces sichuanensis TaxID=2871810 RepID=UPI001CE285EB|nr:hypothetical protein [Streptomyces sichuanensis]MCA6090797.1 hypothetical protein [Streptomyces sichuanensis]